jgi:hypothetical protein
MKTAPRSREQAASVWEELVGLVKVGVELALLHVGARHLALGLQGHVFQDRKKVVACAAKHLISCSNVSKIPEYSRTSIITISWSPPNRCKHQSFCNHRM